MSRSDLLSGIARRISGSNPPCPTGVLAALRRVTPAHPGPFAAQVYGFLADCGIDLERPADDLRRWTLLAHVLALARGRHDRKIRVGEALLDIHFSEARLKQLLNADQSVLRELLPRLARRLDAQGQAMDFHPIMDLVFAREDAELEQARLSIAQSYVIANAKKNKGSAT